MLLISKSIPGFWWLPWTTSLALKQSKDPFANSFSFNTQWQGMMLAPLGGGVSSKVPLERRAFHSLSIAAFHFAACGDAIAFAKEGEWLVVMFDCNSCCPSSSDEEDDESEDWSGVSGVRSTA